MKFDCGLETNGRVSVKEFGGGDSKAYLTLQPSMPSKGHLTQPYNLWVGEGKLDGCTMVSISAIRACSVTKLSDETEC